MMYADVMPAQIDKPIATTVRLDAAHQRLLVDLQREHPGVSTQRLFEMLLENDAARRQVDVDALITRVMERDSEALTRLRDL